MNMPLGNKIRAYREAMGVTQAELASFLGMEQSHVSKIESGERTVSATVLEQLSALFGVSCEELMDSVCRNPRLVCAFRKNGLDSNDLKTISAINRIALNADFMHSLLKSCFQKTTKELSGNKCNCFR